MVDILSVLSLFFRPLFSQRPPKAPIILSPVNSTTRPPIFQRVLSRFVFLTTMTVLTAVTAPITTTRNWTAWWISASPTKPTPRMPSKTPNVSLIHIRSSPDSNPGIALPAGTWTWAPSAYFYTTARTGSWPAARPAMWRPGAGLYRSRIAGGS